MIRVAVSYRVLQTWRVSVFSRLSKLDGIDLCVFHGETFEGSKVKNHTGPLDFKTVQLPTLKANFNTRNGPVHLPVTIGLWRALRQFDPDVIITEGASNAFNNVVCYLFARRKGCKIVQWGLGKLKGRTLSLPRRIMDMLFFRYIERNSDAAIAYSSIGAEYYLGLGMPKERVFVAVNTVDTEARQAMARQVAQNGFPSPVPEQFNILFVGALTRTKNIDMLVRCFAAFAQDKIDARLTIVGDGEFMQELVSLAATLGISTKTEFSGHVHEGIAHYFLNATVMVLPGLGGLAVSDALCHGVPVICGIGDGAEADLVDGSNGQILDPMNIGTLQQTLERLYADRDLQASWRAAAPKVIEGTFNVHTYVAELSRCIHEVAGV